MKELVPGTVDAAKEKHIPVAEVNGNLVKVSVGSVLHPMSAEHHIAFVVLETNKGFHKIDLDVTGAPEAVFALLPDDHDGLVRAGEKEGKFYVDLREAIARRLVQLGLKRENILVSEECTVCSHDKYWSHRYTQGNRGSQAALIMIDD
jgi:desulfoferrodoxin